MPLIETGINRRLDELGRIVIPIEIRRNLNMNEGDSILFATQGDSIVLTKFKPRDERIEETIYGLKSVLNDGTLNNAQVRIVETAIDQLKGY